MTGRGGEVDLLVRGNAMRFTRGQVTSARVSSGILYAADVE